jgi:hypothetical protein
MALPSTYRWIILGNLVIRKHENAPPEAPLFTLDEVFAAALKRIELKKHYREYGNKNSRIMWFSHFEENEEYYILLADVGDKQISPQSFVHFATLESRDTEKQDDEGGHYTAHVLIRKEMNCHGHRLILIEKVPGINISSLKNHFGWICRDIDFKKSYVDMNGKVKTCHPVFEIDGHQSTTIREALRTGELKDIQFVKHEESFEDGLDEDLVLKEVIHEAKLGVGRKVSDEEATKLFSITVPKFLNRFKNGIDTAGLFVRIKTPSGQIKRTEIEMNEEEILEQAFVQNEIVTDFDELLSQRHKLVRRDMVSKMIEIVQNIYS